MLVDKRWLFSGIAILAFGIIGSLYMNSILPTGVTGMTEEDKFLLVQEQGHVTGIQALFGIASGIGFLLLLISFGATKKKKDGDVKTVSKKPDT